MLLRGADSAASVPQTRLGILRSMGRTAFRLTTSLLLTMFIIAPALAAVCQANCVRAAAHHAAGDRLAADEGEDCHHAANADVLRLTSAEPCGTLMVVTQPVRLVTSVRVSAPSEARLMPAVPSSAAARMPALALATGTAWRSPLEDAPPLSPGRRFSVLRI